MKSVGRTAARPVALEGYCPVELVRHGRWVAGDAGCTAVYNGRTYRFSSDAHRQQFLSDPERFAPANSGNDRVLSVTRQQTMPGQTTYCAIYRNRVYLFSSAATQSAFAQTRNATRRKGNDRL